MKNPFKAMTSARRLLRAGRPLSAAMTFRNLLFPPASKHKRRISKPPRLGASKAPTARPGAGTFSSGHFKGKHGERRYKIYIPTGPARRRCPLVVLLHGCGQTPEDFARGTGMNALAEGLGVMVLYPEQPPSANLGRCWNWHRVGNQRRGGGEPATIAALTRQIVTTCRANPARVYIAGISAGGVTAAIVASAYPEVYAAVGIHSGLLHGDVTTLTGALARMRKGAVSAEPALKRMPLPTIVFHGDKDAVVNPLNAGDFLDRLPRSSSASLRSEVTIGRSDGGKNFTRTLHRRGTGEVLLENWLLHDVGHAWSGGSRAGTCTDPTGPDASREMLRFFLERRKIS